jgi:hypothetical protein
LKPTLFTAEISVREKRRKEEKTGQSASSGSAGFDRFFGGAYCFGAGFGYEFRALSHAAFRAFAAGFAVILIVYG